MAWYDGRRHEHESWVFVWMVMVGVGEGDEKHATCKRTEMKREDQSCDGSCES